jgi:ABC-2 type transport system ATP-binding protein
MGIHGLVRAPTLETQISDLTSDPIQVTNLKASYDSKIVLDDVSFSIKQGEIFGLLGPNGAGKSTCIKLLLGHKHPDGGQVQVLGTLPWQAPSSWRQQISWLGDNSGMQLRFSGWKNLELFASLYGVPKKRIKDLAESFDIVDFLDQSVQQMSKGQRQRLALARALLNEPKALFLDEPTSGLDLQSAARLRDDIRKCCKSGTAVLLTTHDLDEAEQICDRVAFLVRGRIAAQGTPSELCQEVLGQPLQELAQRVSLSKVFWKLSEN